MLSADEEDSERGAALVPRSEEPRHKARSRPDLHVEELANLHVTLTALLMVESEG